MFEKQVFREIYTDFYRIAFERVLFTELMQDGCSAEQNEYRAVDFTVASSCDLK